MERPNNVPQYDDIDLKLGIKSSLPNVKETLALFLLMWRSCGKASVLDYCVSDGNNLKVEPTLLGNLHTAVRNVSSEEECSFEQLDALIANNHIKRLSDRIDQRVPFKNFLKGIESFAKAIILPIITYVAGVYSAGLEEISIDVVATYAVFIIMLLGIVRLSWVGFSDIAKTFFCRDYNAAIAFREDLLDLRLLYFRIDKDANKND